MTKALPTKKLKGMSLVELLVYIGIIAAFIISVSYLVFSIDSLAQKSSSWTEVNGNIRFVTSKMTHVLRTADSVTSDSTTFSATKDGSTYQFYVTDNVLYMVVDGAEKNMSSSKVNVTLFGVENLTTAGERESISVSIAIEYKNPDGKAELNVSQENRISVTLRQ